MNTFDIIASLGLEIAKFINTPQSEKWAKEILEIKKDVRDEENKPSIEERESFPSLDDKDFRNTSYITELNIRMLDVCQAILSSRGTK